MTAATAAAAAHPLPLLACLACLPAERAGVKGVTTPMDIANQISKGLAKKAVVAKVDSAAWDLLRPLQGDCALQLLCFEDAEGKEVRCRPVLLARVGASWPVCKCACTVRSCMCCLWLFATASQRACPHLPACPSPAPAPAPGPPPLPPLQAFWHSSAHVLGQALELEFGADLTIGPALEEGFYYDCYLGDNKSLTEAEKSVITKRMQQVRVRVWRGVVQVCLYWCVCFAFDCVCSGGSVCVHHQMGKVVSGHQVHAASRGVGDWLKPGRCLRQFLFNYILTIVSSAEHQGEAGV